MTEENKQNNDQENDYKGSSKAGDFFIGFFCFVSTLFIPWLNFIAVIASIILAIYVIKKKERRFIGIGIIAGLVAVLLVFGGCLFMLQGV